MEKYFTKEILRCVQEIYSKLYDILSIFTDTECYNIVPDGEDEFTYYRSQVDKIENLVAHIEYLAPKELVNELRKVIFEVKEFVCKFEIPGVNESWYEANEKLKYYSIEYDIAMERPLSYCLNSDNKDDKVSLKSVRKSIAYFNLLDETNNHYNFKYNKDDFFQQELLNTLKIIFDERILKFVRKGELSEDILHE